MNLSPKTLKIYQPFLFLKIEKRKFKVENLEKMVGQTLSFNCDYFYGKTHLTFRIYNLITQVLKN
jgi:hypothetical protein